MASILSPAGSVARSHPLDQLGSDEVRRSAAAVRAYTESCLKVGDVRFNAITLQEPPKHDLLRFEQGLGPRPPRRALCIVVLPSSNVAAEAVVELAPDAGGAWEGGQGVGGAPLLPSPTDVPGLPPKGAGPAVSVSLSMTWELRQLSPQHAAGASAAGPPCADTLVSWQLLDGVHPMTTPDDNTMAEEVVKADPTVRKLLRERYGLTDLALLVCDTWACHNAPAHLNHLRLMQGFLYLRACPGDNEYAHPLDMVPIVDLNAQRVVHIDMWDKPPAVPKLSSNYRSDLVDPSAFRTDVKPLDVVQPEGPSFTVDGSLVCWQRWRVRVGFNYREGLVLHGLSYEDPEQGGRPRPVLHRASLVEMAVPYGDPNYILARKCAMDSGDYGFGFCANSLLLGCDCLGHIKYFDGVVNNARGEPVVIRNAVCLHEEDAGILWKHFDARTGRVEVRRARKLVIQTVSTFQNYEYIMAWELWQDGSIHFVMKLSGILSTSLAPEGEGPRPSFGVRVAPGVNATVHQHFFCVRLDPSVDDPEGGREVMVSEVQAVALPPGPANPSGNAFRMEETDLDTTTKAQRDVDFGSARCWLLKNPRVVNPITSEPVAYRLMPGPTPKMMMAPGSLVWKRAAFAQHNLWVTPYVEGQLYPAGDHVVQSRTCLGLAEWTKQERSLRGADPVVWYSFGITHAPRVEDYPVMPVEVVGFMMRPASFFTQNPAVDVPSERNKASRLYEDGPGHRGAPQAPAGGECCKMASTPQRALPAPPPRSRL